MNSPGAHPGAWTLRYRIAEHMPIWLAARLNLRQYQPLGTFEAAAMNGFQTANFDLEANFAEGEARSGLDDEALSEVRRIMDRCVSGLSFGVGARQTFSL